MPSIMCYITDERKEALTMFRAELQGRGYGFPEKDVIEALIDLLNVPETRKDLFHKLIDSKEEPK